MPTILVCDDDKQIVEAINIYLTGEGFNVIKAYDGYEALDLLEKNEVNLMIVDVMMPGLDGIRTTLKVRETSSIPIIILSAKSEDTDKILGLNIGADDYITKPFNPLELVARVKSQLRRYTQLGNLNQQGSSQVYKCGGLMINDENKEVTVDGEPIKLTPIEYNILLLLVKNAGKVFSIDQIYEKIWNEDAIGADYDFSKGEHRTMTFVFVKERSPEGIREALDNRRTAVYYRELVIGREEILRPFFEKCVDIKEVKRTEKEVTFSVMNATDLVLKLKKTAHDPSLVYFREMTLKPHTQHTISVKLENGIKRGDCNFEVTNFIVAPDKGLDYTIKL